MRSLARFPARAAALSALLPTDHRPQWALLTKDALHCGYLGDERFATFQEARLDGAGARHGAAAALDGFRPSQTPHWAASATASYRMTGGGLFAATLRHVGKQFEDDQETDVLPAATTVDLFAQVRLIDQDGLNGLVAGRATRLCPRVPDPDNFKRDASGLGRAGALRAHALPHDAPPHHQTGRADFCDRLAALDGAMAELWRRHGTHPPGLVFYLAGADPHEGDRLGRLKLTTEGLAERDRRMSSIYYSALAGADGSTRRRLRASRDRFLRYRENCPNAACIAQAYRDRMDEIRDIAADR